MLCKVSVVVPVLNREHLIERCLESVINQTQKPYELIVVDNGSDDNTKEKVRDWMRLHSNSGVRLKLIEERKRGACEARQRGLEETTGDYISFFDSDDEMDPRLIEKVLEEINSNTQVDIICWRCEIKLLNGKSRLSPFDLANPLSNHLLHTLLRTDGYIVRKSFLERAGGWSKSLKVWNDLELGLRLLMNRPTLKGLDEVLVKIHSQRGSITGLGFLPKKGDWEMTLAEMKKEVLNSDYNFKEDVFKILNYRKAILAANYYKEGDKKSSEHLMATTIEEASGWKEKLILKFSFLYTRYGLRGAWRFLPIVDRSISTALSGSPSHFSRHLTK